MNVAYISIGSNINKEANIITCLKKLRNLCAVKEVSLVYETRPVGDKDQESFLNAALILETPLTPEELKSTVLDTVEKALGRRRTEDKNAPRTIDLDISLFNQWIFTLGKRKIPDPEILTYPHIAIPLAEIAPDYIHPVTGETLAQIAARFNETEGIKRRDDIFLK
jgi:2-amino-4-hydroxy-6-hydroxymethyldihydropteridine diphosphokinase